MSFLPPSSVKSSVTPTQSQIAVSNLVAIINRINHARAQESVTPAWLRDQVKDFSESLNSYIAEGGDPSEMLWTVHFCKSLVTVTSTLLGDAPVGEDFQTMKEVVIHVTAITETLGQSAFGDRLDCRWHGFIVNHVCRSTFGES